MLKRRLVSGTALAGVPTTRQWLREDPILDEALHVPFGRAFSMPSPEEPASVGLVGIELCLDKMSEVVLVVLG